MVHDNRIERGKYLESLIELSNIVNLLDIKARNGIEHFDERIDKLALKQYKKQINKSLVLYNMTISRKSLIQSVLSEKTKHLKPYYLKIYVVEEKTAYIDNKSLDLAKVKEEAIYLENMASKILNEESPGGSMIVIP